MPEPGGKCWELLEPDEEEMESARVIYEATQPQEERMPWEWIEQGVRERVNSRPGTWRSHLILAGEERGLVSGFAWGACVPRLGGYLGYLGVDESQRGQGFGSRLIRTMAQVVQADLAEEGKELPFLIWESHRPEPWSSATDRANWLARLSLFQRVGARWMSGLDFHAPAFARASPSVVMQLFLLPMRPGVDSYGPDQLCDVAATLFREVYGRGPKDPLVRASLLPDCRPTLAPPLAANVNASQSRHQR